LFSLDFVEQKMISKLVGWAFGGKKDKIEGETLQNDGEEGFATPTAPSPPPPPLVPPKPVQNGNHWNGQVKTNRLFP